jgi:hypothetical protein
MRQQYATHDSSPAAMAGDEFFGSTVTPMRILALHSPVG